MTMEMSKSMVTFALAVVALLAAPAAGWSKGSSTFYGGGDASGTMGGACGYGNQVTTWYGTATAALSPALFNGGASCGQCYQIACDYQTNPQWCRQPGATVTVTATNLCPANPSLPNNQGGWCNTPRAHFDMAQPAWEKIGVYQGGIIPVLYQPVQCARQGGVRFTINGGKNYFELVLISNVAGSGSVKAVWVQGTSTVRTAMSMNWGANWQSTAGLVGQALTFGVTSTGGQTIVFQNVVMASWQFGQSFISNLQFSY